MECFLRTYDKKRYIISFTYSESMIIYIGYEEKIYFIYLID